MKIEIRKVNEPTGKFWYGIWVNDDCQIPSYGDNLEAAEKAYSEIIEAQKTPLPRYEIIKEETL